MEISNEWQCDRWAWYYISSYSAPPVWYLCYIEGLCSSLQVALMCDILMICCFTRYLRIGMLKLTVLIRIMPAPSIIQKMILSSFSSTWIGCVIVRILVSIKYTHTHTKQQWCDHPPVKFYKFQFHSRAFGVGILFVHAQLNVRAICPSVREMLVYGSCHTGLVKTAKQYFRKVLE